MADQVMDSNGDMREAAQTMASTEKKCPGCGAALDFSAAVGKLKCPYCETEVDIPAVVQEAPKMKVGVGQVQKEGAAQENLLDFKHMESSGNRDWGTATKIFSCKYCGAEMVMDVNSLSTTCEFCGSNHVTEAADDKGMLSPGGVVPFQITQQQASDLFKKWIGAKFFAPNAAKKSAQAEAFHGVYLPYWTFDAVTDTDYTGKYGKDRRVKDKDGNTKTVTDWYNTFGAYNEFIDDQLICASKNHTESFLKSIEPFNTGDNKVYSPEYLSGFKAERYTVSLEDGWNGATKDIERHLRSVIASKIRTDNRADHGEVITMNVHYSKMTYKYLLLPVWFSSFTFNGKVFQFAVNGQTGKVAGKSPVSGLKVFLTILAIVAVIVILYIIFGN
ncbi:MAG: hypothetical protein MJ130_11190 [Lachnospiraceae bacterium]|nr:hypothetical protein [Lachnospiraceae bacterium]